MAPDHVQRVIDLLWPDGEGPGTSPVFALLDGARDPRIEPMIRFSQRQYRCLYSGRLSPALTAAAPCVVFLAREGRFTPELIEAAWGRSWGQFIVGNDDCTHEQLRRHFRRYLKVRDEDGHTYLFRFYDPRVLRIYLPTCTPLEREAFFGPVQRFVIDDGTPAARPVVLDPGRPQSTTIAQPARQPDLQFVSTP
jgi:hypothetical protein